MSAESHGEEPGDSLSRVSNSSATFADDEDIIGSYLNSLLPSPQAGDGDGATPSASESTDGLVGRTSATGNPNETSVKSATEGVRPIYAGLLSRVAVAFVKRISLQTKFKDSLEYQNAFDGREAIDVLVQLVPSRDRRAALALGRALNAQAFFHDVTYDSQLKDSASEIFKFSAQISPQLLLAQSESGGDDADIDAQAKRDDTVDERGVDALDFPTGVFTSLTACYASTCTRKRVCYSYTCPRRQALLRRAGSRRPSLSKVVGRKAEEQNVWVTSVPTDIVKSLTNREIKRQEIIFEVVYTESDFVRDLKTLHELYIKPLKSGDILKASTKARLIHEIFYNIDQIYKVNGQLSKALQRRQRDSFIVARIGDIFAAHVPNFTPYVTYSGHQPYASDFLATERRENEAFREFLQAQERRPESRKLPIQSFLGRPTTRLARYPLLLEAVLKTTDDAAEHADLTAAIDVIKGFLQRINIETGKADNILRVRQIATKLTWKAGTFRPIGILNDDRQLIRDGTLRRRFGHEGSDNTVFLFDNCLLVTKKKSTRDSYEFRVTRIPIPLELLQIVNSGDILSIAGAQKPNSVKRAAPYILPFHLSAGDVSATDTNEPDPEITSLSTHSITPVTSRSPTSFPPGHGSFDPPLPKLSLTIPHAAAGHIAAELAKGGFPIVMNRLGREAEQIILHANSIADQKAWHESLQSTIQGRSSRPPIITIEPVFDSISIGAHFPKINCSANFGKFFLITRFFKILFL